MTYDPASGCPLCHTGARREPGTPFGLPRKPLIRGDRPLILLPHIAMRRGDQSLVPLTMQAASCFLVLLVLLLLHQERLSLPPQIHAFEKVKLKSKSPSEEKADQVLGDLSETDISNEAQDPRTPTDTTEEKRRNRLYELAMKMSEKETSSGEDQESEPKTESENQKESLSSEDNSQSVQEELKKAGTTASSHQEEACLRERGSSAKTSTTVPDVWEPEQRNVYMPVDMVTSVADQCPQYNIRSKWSYRILSRSSRPILKT
ncbi:hypothetical protein P7K49_031352 [Saguinus oedipus]|uniref:Rab effector MyRIP/Melanophilin domain-containing protein n=1 Tax=Saguinus oedipus TaxID=9490 RepID=A0ABQ9TZW2_SAGOE|nr:hypothetical protein P7K49_031352 [Saguinus oedipus]